MTLISSTEFRFLSRVVERREASAPTTAPLPDEQTPAGLAGGRCPDYPIYFFASFIFFLSSFTVGLLPPPVAATGSSPSLAFWATVGTSAADVTAVVAASSAASSSA